MKFTRILVLFGVLAVGAVAAPILAQSDLGAGTTCTTDISDGSGLPECGTPDDNECYPGGVLYREENQDGCASAWYWKAGWYLARFFDGEISREDFPTEFASVLPPLPKPVVVEVIPLPSTTEPVDEPVIEEPTATPTVEEPTATPTVEEPTATPTVEEPTATPTVEEPTATPTVEEPTATPTVEEPTATPTVEEPTATPPAYSGSCTGSYDPFTGVGVLDANWTPVPAQKKYTVIFHNSGFYMMAYGSVGETDSSFSNMHNYNSGHNITGAQAIITDEWGNNLLNMTCDYKSVSES